MAKLPDNFVKPPPASSRIAATRPTAPKLGRRSRKLDDAALDAEAGSHVHSVMVRLTAEEHEALSAASTALATLGQAVSIEDMIKQVIARWITATRALAAPAVPVPATPAAPPAATIQAQLRRLAAEPLRRWHELGRAVRRWSRVLDLRARG
jgi:ATP-dependent exoDNAse (exonuclease V) beta subunit